MAQCGLALYVTLQRVCCPPFQSCLCTFELCAVLLQEDKEHHSRAQRIAPDSARLGQEAADAGYELSDSAPGMEGMLSEVVSLRLAMRDLQKQHKLKIMQQELMASWV